MTTEKALELLADRLVTTIEERSQRFGGITIRPAATC